MAKDYFTVVPNLPKFKMDVGRVRLEMLNELRKEGRAVRRELKRTVSTWRGDRPDFEFTISLAGGDASLLVAPSGNAEGVKKWYMLDGGTRPHVIRAKQAPRLRFYAKGFRAKTRPNWVGAGTGQRADQAFRQPQQVFHPGTKPRNWVSVVVARRYYTHVQNMMAAMERGLEKAMK